MKIANQSGCSRGSVYSVVLTVGCLLLGAASIWLETHKPNDFPAIETPPGAKAEPPVAEPKAEIAPDAATEPEKQIMAVVETIPNEYSETVNDVARQTVPVRAEFGRERSFGTGFVIEDGIVVTAAHILGSRGYSYLTGVFFWCGNRQVEGEVLVYDDLRDVAVVSADCFGRKLKLNGRTPQDKDQLYVAGFSYAMDKIATSRYLRPTWPNNVHELKIRGPESMNFRLAFQLRQMELKKIPRLRAIDRALLPGNSGSVVFAPDGSVVGMVVVVDQFLDVSFITPAANLRHALQEAELAF